MVGICDSYNCWVRWQISCDNWGTSIGVILMTMGVGLFGTFTDLFHHGFWELKQTEEQNDDQEEEQV